MKKAIFIIIVVGMIGWVLYDFTDSKEEDTNDEQEVTDSNEEGLERGQIAPDFELLTLDGESAKLSDFRGQRVMLNFWATWCPPCRAEMPDMQKFHEDKDVKILAVNLIDTESAPDNVPAFLEELEITFPVLLDRESELANRYRISAYPTSFMIDSNGRIQFKVMGAINYDLMIQEFEKME